MTRLPLLAPGLVVALGFSAAWNANAQGPDTDPEVTSDTPAYCDVLRERISGMVRAASSPPTEAVVLSREGEKMCVNGQIRGGLMRLRRAIALMRHGED